MLETLETIVTTEICPDCHSTQCVRVPEFDEFDNYLMPECDVNNVCLYDCEAHKVWLV
tara:strand:+ start:267 stop:440 length:174 start_codon:yes stop_codon:yes gene_type:complete